jgi:predicted dinucleotide-binding enzyme
VGAQFLGALPPARADGPKVEVFYAGDDAGAKDTVRRLIESVAFEPVDAGPLANARYLEPLGMLSIWFGYAGGRGTGAAPRWQAV